MAKANDKRQRTCIACGQRSSKESLLRIVRHADSVGFDPRGNVPGRGAYVCSKQCFDRAGKSRRLDRALRTRISDGDYETIEAALAALGTADSN